MRQAILVLAGAFAFVLGIVSVPVTDRIERWWRKRGVDATDRTHPVVDPQRAKRNL